MGRRRAALAIAASLAGLAAPPVATAGVIFGGVTSQREPIVIQVTPRRAKVALVRWEWRARCTLGPAAPAGTAVTTAWSDSAGPFPVDRRGRWSARFTGGPFVNDPATGVSERFTYRLGGMLLLHGAVMRGTIQATYTQSSPTGVIRECNSGVTRYVIRD